MIRSVRNTRLIAIVMLLAMIGAASALSQGRSGPRGRAGIMHHRASDLSEAEYLAMMIPHHQEAVDRSRELLQITEREEMRDLLNSIIAEQSREIELMKGWLADRYPDLDPMVEYAPMMRGYEGLEPDEADLVFLEDMLPHHMHAVMSSRMLIRSGAAEHDDVEDLAASIIGSQLSEIERMRSMYADWYAYEREYGHGGRTERGRGRR